MWRRTEEEKEEYGLLAVGYPSNYCCSLQKQECHFISFVFFWNMHRDQCKNLRNLCIYPTRQMIQLMQSRYCKDTHTYIYCMGCKRRQYPKYGIRTHQWSIWDMIASFRIVIIYRLEMFDNNCLLKFWFDLACSHQQNWISDYCDNTTSNMRSSRSNWTLLLASCCSVNSKRLAKTGKMRQVHSWVFFKVKKKSRGKSQKIVDSKPVHIWLIW